eukprot:12582.XXX_456636_456794_1 [CDS] Oithona nana genome sequencing.
MIVQALNHKTVVDVHFGRQILYFMTRFRNSKHCQKSETLRILGYFSMLPVYL